METKRRPTEPHREAAWLGMPVTATGQQRPAARREWLPASQRAAVADVLRAAITFPGNRNTSSRMFV